MNLFKETEEVLVRLKKTWADVSYIYAKVSDWDIDDNKAYLIPIDLFVPFAERFDYDNGFGGAEVNPTLRIVFNDGSWLERSVYDGAEEWMHKALEKPKKNYPADVRYLISSKYEDMDMRDKIRFGKKEGV